MVKYKLLDKYSHEELCNTEDFKDATNDDIT